MDYTEECSSPSWNWQVDNYNNQPQSHFSDVQDCTMTEVVALNQEDHSYMFNDLATPVKDCSEFRYHVTTDETNKKLEVVQSETRSVLKRRRMLRFEDNPDETSLFSSENFSSILKSSAREEDTFDELLPEGTQLIEGFSEEASPSSLDDIDLYAEEWYAECLNNAETPILSSDLNFGSLDVQVDISEYLNVPQEPEAREVQRRVIRSSPNVIFKGRNSFSRPVSNLPSSIIYPFAFIKPCGVHGDMTLKDINQRIRTPPTKPKEDEEDELVVIQTSAFSGKPVVGKTKIRTEGEIQGLLWAMRSLLDLERLEARIATDCLDLMAMTKTPSDWPAFKAELSDFSYLVSRFSLCNFFYVPRLVNSQADRLAKLARSRSPSYTHVRSSTSAPLSLEKSS